MRHAKRKPRYKTDDELWFLGKHRVQVIRYSDTIDEYLVAGFGDEMWVQEKDLSTTGRDPHE